ncbi:Efg1 domain-containing protein [Aspergillus homomorphus CBS 101889]|uniref:rRNA-processing protein EFG1 n=1 Tax=Aspergillus homomorphus (strain CBS 101889) TaxID=1450537 RepID=A0A395HIC4_ASPHC|nr:nuclear protein [Aspergillus homomorphus CBS 101889]RAL07500.1 nuclear protein [Aspergillus homomorphus CBS 101889]
MPREYQPNPRPSKRKHEDDNLDEASTTHSHSHHNRRPHKKILLKDNPDFTSVNHLKKRIRDAKRLLAKPDLPADVRVTQERALMGYERDLEEEVKSRERSKMIKKYHFIRFLERKTAQKEISRLTRLEKELSENNSTNAEMDAATKAKKLASIAKKLHVARVNLNYTIYYPLDQKYSALYADQKKSKKAAADGKEDVSPSAKDVTPEEKEEDAAAAAAAAAEKSAMWQTVEQCMKDDTLDLLRDGKLNKKAKAEATDESVKTSGDKSKKARDRADGSQPDKKKKQRSEDHKSSGRAKTDDRKKRPSAKQEDYEMRDAGNDDGEDSDGGFFEM